MKPLNEKQRRRAFWKFTGLFLLAVLPVCIALYLFGRVDKTENNFLRKEYAEKTTNQAKDNSANKNYEKLHQKIKGVNSLLTRSAPNALTNKSYGDIDVAIDGLDDELREFKNSLSETDVTAGVDTWTSRMIALQIENLRLLNSIYKQSDNEIKSLDEDLEETKDDLEDAEDDLEKCQSKLQ